MCFRFYAQFVYAKFCAETATKTTYAYFIKVWNQRCPKIMIKKSMRFAKCDYCTLTMEALNQQRIHGGSEWLNEDIEQVTRGRSDHYEVSVSTHYGGVQTFS